MTKKYYWLKLKDSFFSQKEIKKLRKIAGGDTYTIIYLKMLLTAIKQGNKLYFEGVEDTFPEELALELDEDSENIKVTLAFLERQGLIQIVNEDEFLLTQCAKMIGTETDSAVRVRKHRENKTLQSNTNVTNLLRKGNTEIDIEIDKDIDIDKKDTNVSKKEATSRINYQEIIDLYHNICKSYSRIEKLTNKRKEAIKARLTSKYAIGDFKTVFLNAESSGFLKGCNERNWKADFDWIIKDSNMAKILEGKYSDRKTIINKPESAVQERYHIPDGNEIVGEIFMEYKNKGLPIPVIDGPFSG